MDVSSAKNFDPNHARVLVVGPMAAGKTTLVHSFCHSGNCATGFTMPTVGCDVEVKLLTGEHANRSIEFWDVGGTPDAALARGMFFEGCEAAGVLLVYDVSNPRSLRDLRAWADELDAAGVRVLHPGSRGISTRSSGRADASSRSSGENDINSQEGVLGQDALDYRERLDSTYGLVDLEGGSRGASSTAIGGRVPLLVVGTKADIGERAQREGGALAAELGARHVTLCATKLADEEPFDRFFGEVFLRHSGQHSLGEEEPERWDGRHRDEDSYFPSRIGAVNNTDLSKLVSQYPLGNRWASESVGKTLRRETVKGKGPKGRENSGVCDTFGTAESMGGNGGLVLRGSLTSALAGAPRSREKQS